MILFCRVTVAFLHLSKDAIILFIPIFSSTNNIESTTVILSKQSVSRLHTLNHQRPSPHPNLMMTDGVTVITIIFWFN